MLDTLDAPAVRRWASLAAQYLRDRQAEIDLINVYPVPDGDTGTNLAATLTAAARAADGDGSPGVGAALAALARGATLGARGNSGVIVSQFLRGLGDAAAGLERWDVAGVQRGLTAAARCAYEAVSEPVEGTMLTVCRAAAERALAASALLADVVRAAVAGATEALAHTPEQLPALRRAGVIDAGGRGLVVLLEALAAVVTGEVREIAPLPAPEPRQSPASDKGHHAGHQYAGYQYEVQYQLAAASEAVAVLRDELGRIGDSVVVAGTGGGFWVVHVHVDDIGAAIEAGLRAGRPADIRVTRFADQPVPSDSAPPAIVAVAPGSGLAHLFEAEGVTVVGDDPTAADVLAAIRATGARSAVLLPNAAQIAGIAERAAAQARADGFAVAVVPTRSPVQGLAAVAVHDPDRRFDDDVVAMAEAAAATRFAEITTAVRDALTSAGPCRAGDVLGLIDGDVVEVGADVEAVALRVVDRLLGAGGELVTVLLGQDAPDGLGERLCRHIEASAIGTEVSVYAGGQPSAPLLLGVE